MEMTRTRERELLVFSTYSCLIRSLNEDQFDPLEVLSDIFELDIDQINIYPKKVYFYMLKHKNEIVQIVTPLLNKWTFDRLNYIAQAIFLIAVCEIAFVKEVDNKIILNESIKIAKKYIPNNDYKYINAVLDRVCKDYGRK